MRSGTKTYPCRVERRTTTRDTIGGRVQTWDTVLSLVWLEIYPIRGAEVTDQEQQIAQVTHRANGDYHDLLAVTEKMRLVHDVEGTFDDVTRNEYFDIEAVLRDHTGQNATMLRLRKIDGEISQ